MRVNEIMTRGVEVVSPQDTIRTAAAKMDDLNVGVLPVCDGQRLVGMITDRDITVRSTAEGLDPWTGHVRDAMTPEVISCSEDDDVAEAARLMKEKQIRRLPVMSRANDLVGIVSLGDLATGAADPGQPGEVLRKVSEPA